MASLLYKSWGENIRAARKEFGWTQDELARIVGITRAHLANIEAGRRPPTDEVKTALAGATRKTFDQLFPWPTDIPAFPVSAIRSAVA